MNDIEIRTRTGLHNLPFEKKFKILRHTSNQAGRTRDSSEQRIHSANKAWWRDAMIYRSKDVPSRVKCRNMVDQVHSVFCSGSENWPWSDAILDRSKGLEAKAMRRLFRFKRKEDEMLTGYCTRKATAARAIWKTMKLPFLSEMSAEKRVESHGMYL